MGNAIEALVHGDPLLDLFLVIGIGVVVGKIRIARVELGSVTGVLVAGLVFGHFVAELPTASHNIGFMFGMAGLIFFIGFLPKVLRIDLVEEVHKLESKDWVKRGRRDPDEYLRLVETPSIRAYRVEENRPVLGNPYSEIDFSLPGDIQRIKREGEVFVPTPETTLQVAGGVIMRF
jgi:uncharacterized transporter YbjL